MPFHRTHNLNFPNTLATIARKSKQGSTLLKPSKVEPCFRDFLFPDNSGTFGLLEANQTWTGLNRFEATTTSTIYIGSATKSGCLVMGDSDENGVTYITANDGILNVTTSKPDICQ